MNAVASVLAVSVSVSVSVVCDQVDQVVPAHQVDDIDEVHELDPVHQVDHKDEHTSHHVTSHHITGLSTEVEEMKTVEFELNSDQVKSLRAGKKNWPASVKR